MKKLKYLLAVLVLSVAVVAISQESKMPEELDVVVWLQKFLAAPKSSINTLPIRDYTDAQIWLEEVKKKQAALLDAIENNTVTIQGEAKTASAWSREFIVPQDKVAVGGKRPWKKNDRPKDLFKEGTKLEYRLSRLPTNAEVDQTPWSSDYWPLRFGSAAMRYSKGEREGYKTWINYINSFWQPKDYLALSGPVQSADIDHYSPAEKYDILMGDSNFTLTNNLRKQGARYVDSVEWKYDSDGNQIGVKDVTGEVEIWMGICHGWAPAAYKVPRPLHSVEATGIKGDTVNFHEDDLKALAVLKWAQSKAPEESPTRFVGTRCNKKADELKPGVDFDEVTGALLADQCADTNAGTWHVAAMNKLKRGESFTIDATFDREVWNQPGVSAQVGFFNLGTQEWATDLEDAITAYDSKIPLYDVRETKRVEVRGAVKPTSVVGVVMKFAYVVETNPKHGPSREDQIVSVDYVYDLELDTEGKIVGGEWYSNKHPDFIWDPATDYNVYPKNGVDKYLAGKNNARKVLEYDGSKESLAAILNVGTDEGNAAQLSSGTNGDTGGLGDTSPLATVVKYLLDESAKRN